MFCPPRSLVVVDRVKLVDVAAVGGWVVVKEEDGRDDFDM